LQDRGLVPEREDLGVSLIAGRGHPSESVEDEAGQGAEEDEGGGTVSTPTRFVEALSSRPRWV